MSSAVADLETNLQAMLGLKPPGVSGSKISTLTSLCIANVQVRMLPPTATQHHCRARAQTHKHKAQNTSTSTRRCSHPARVMAY